MGGATHSAAESFGSSEDPCGCDAPRGARTWAPLSLAYLSPVAPRHGTAGSVPVLGFASAGGLTLSRDSQEHATVAIGAAQ